MADKSVLSGDLTFLGLGDLLQLLGTNASTGILTLKSKYIADTGNVFFVNGNPIHAQAGAKSGLDGLMALFGWIDGEFAFSPGPVNAGQTIKKSRNAIILDGLQLLDDGKIERLGPVAFKEKGGGADKDSALPLVRGPLVDYMYVVSEEEFADGMEIIAEGSHGSWVWIILDGIVEIAKKSPTGKIPLLRLTSGAYIGSLAAFRPGDYVRSATVTAVGNVQLGVLDSQRMSVEFSRMSYDLKALALSLDRRLKQVTVCTAQVKTGQAPQPLDLQGQGPLIDAGHGEDGLWVVDQGRVSVVAGVGQQSLCLAVLGPNDFFGRFSFLDFGQEPETAGVFGGADLVTRPIDEKKLAKEFFGLSLAFKNFFENVATSVAATTKLCCLLHRKTLGGTKGVAPATAKPLTKAQAKPS